MNLWHIDCLVVDCETGLGIWVRSALKFPFRRAMEIVAYNPRFRRAVFVCGEQ